MKKLVVITGASSGFGLEMAKLFNKNDYPMLLLSRNIKELEEMNFENAMIRSVDITNYNEFSKAIIEAETKFGKTDLLINNAGVMLLGDVSKQDPNEWKTMLDTNVIGVLNGIQCVLEDMKKRNAGTIINISSLAGKKTFLNHAAYCASKYGVHALSETIREEVSQDNVRISIIAPGAAETKLLSHTTDEDIKAGYNQWKETMGGITLDPVYIAQMALMIYELPQDVCIREIDIATTKQDN